MATFSATRNAIFLLFKPKAAASSLFSGTPAAQSYQKLTRVTFTSATKHNTSGQNAAAGGYNPDQERGYDEAKAAEAAKRSVDKAQEKAEQARDKSHDLKEKAKDRAEEMKESAKDYTHDTKESTKGMAQSAAEKAKEGGYKAAETAERTRDKTKEAARDSANKAENAIESAAEKTKETVKGAWDAAVETTQKIKETVVGKDDDDGGGDRKTEGEKRMDEDLTELRRKSGVQDHNKK